MNIELITMLIIPFEQATCEFSDFYEVLLMNEATTNEFNGFYETNSIPDVDDDEVLFKRENFNQASYKYTIGLLDRIKKKSMIH